MTLICSTRAETRLDVPQIGHIPESNLSETELTAHVH